MKARPLRILFSLLMAGALLFSQVGLAYFHDAHDAHEHIDKAHQEQTELHGHGEHCKVCSIDLFFSLFVESPDRVCTIPDSSIEPEVIQESFLSTHSSFSHGRAPPSLG